MPKVDLESYDLDYIEEVEDEILNENEYYQRNRKRKRFDDGTKIGGKKHNKTQRRKPKDEE